MWSMGRVVQHEVSQDWLFRRSTTAYCTLLSSGRTGRDWLVGRNDKTIKRWDPLGDTAGNRGGTGEGRGGGEAGVVNKKERKSTGNLTPYAANYLVSQLALTVEI